METLKDFFTHPAFFAFVGGLLVGSIFLVMAWTSHMKTRKELRRFQKHLSEKLEIEGETIAAMKKDMGQLKQENENLRMKIGGSNLNESSHALERELELYARAEKMMVVKAPGFAQAWESAKDAAHAELVEEERGKSLPRRIFRKFFSTGGAEAPRQLAMKDEDEDSSNGSGKETRAKAGATEED